MHTHVHTCTCTHTTYSYYTQCKVTEQISKINTKQQQKTFSHFIQIRLLFYLTRIILHIAILLLIKNFLAILDYSLIGFIFNNPLVIFNVARAETKEILASHTRSSYVIRITWIWANHNGGLFTNRYLLSKLNLLSILITLLTAMRERLTKATRESLCLGSQL